MHELAIAQAAARCHQLRLGSLSEADAACPGKQSLRSGTFDAAGDTAAFASSSLMSSLPQPRLILGATMRIELPFWPVELVSRAHCHEALIHRQVGLPVKRPDHGRSGPQHHWRGLSRDRTFRTLFRTAPDIPDTFSDIFPDTFGQHTGQLPDIIGHFTGQYRT